MYTSHDRDFDRYSPPSVGKAEYHQDFEPHAVTNFYRMLLTHHNVPCASFCAWPAVLCYPVLLNICMPARFFSETCCFLDSLSGVSSCSNHLLCFSAVPDNGPYQQPRGYEIDGRSRQKFEMFYRHQSEWSSRCRRCTKCFRVAMA